jgi:hypothetical protein
MEPSKTTDIDYVEHPKLKFNDKWEHYKPLLETLYLDKKIPLSEIRTFMRDRYQFDAL